MTDHRPARAAARYGAVVALAGALVAPGAALTAPTAFADSKLPIGVASDPAATPSATPSAEQSKTADPTLRVTEVHRLQAREPREGDRNHIHREVSRGQARDARRGVCQ